MSVFMKVKLEPEILSAKNIEAAIEVAKEVKKLGIEGVAVKIDEVELKIWPDSSIESVKFHYYLEFNKKEN